MIEELMNEEKEQLTPTELSEITALAMQQLELEKDVKAAQEVLDDLTKKLRHVSEVAIPEAMASVGMNSFELENGAKVTIKEDTHPSIRSNYTTQALQFLEERGFGSVIKDQITINLRKGEKPLSRDFAQLAANLGVNMSEKMSVHPGTLKSLVKEQIEKGVDFPEEFFSIFHSKKTIIK